MTDVDDPHGPVPSVWVNAHLARSGQLASVAALRVVDLQPSTTTTNRTRAMNTREMIATYLTYGVEAVRALDKLDQNDPRWDEVSNGVITSVTIAVTLADLRAQDPDRADELVALIESVLSDQDTAAAMLEQWGHTHNRGEDFRLTEVPDVDDGPVLTPEEAAHLDRQARAALNTLAQFDKPHADRLWINYQNPDHPTSANDVMREAGAAITQHQAQAAQASPAYRDHQEPKR